MKKIALALLFIVLIVTVAYANNLTLVYSAGQDTQIQTKAIPYYNAKHCRSRGLAASCTSAQLVTAGCVVKVSRSFTVDSCTIFTADATGEAALAQELANNSFASLAEQVIALQDSVAFCNAFKAMTTVQQNVVCTSMVPSQGNGCSVCP